MNNKFCILLLGMFALASSALNAQTTAVSDTMMLSVDDCVKIALNENPTIKIADMEITRVDYSKKETIGQLFPNVSFSAAYSRTLAKQTMYMNNGGQTMAIKMGRDNTHNAGFNASMPLISVALWKSIKLSDNQILQNIEASRTSRISLINQVKNAYYALLLAYDSYDVLVENHATAKVNADIYEKKFKNGTASEFDVLRSSVAVKNIEPSIIEAQNSIRSLELQLKVLMGMDVNQGIKPNTSLSDFKSTMYADVMAMNSDLSMNADLRKLDLQTDYLKKAVDVQKASWLPTLSATIGYNWYSMSDGSPFKNFNWSPNSSVGLSLSWTLFNGGQRYYKQKQAELSYKEMAWQRDNLSRTLEMQRQIQLDNIQKNVKQIETCTASVEQAIKANQIQEKSFKIGASTYLDLRDSEDALMSSKLAYYQAIYNYLVAKSDLELLLGNADVQYPATTKDASIRTKTILNEKNPKANNSTASENK
ncbi:MAG: TolC family protein [Muribaculaceae bacterium]